MKKLFCLMAFFVILLGCMSDKSFNASDVILLVNSNTQAEVAITKIIPYLNHFGVKYQTVDVVKEAMPPKENDPALIIIGHPEIVTSHDLTARLEKFISACQSRGTGILSFDPLMPSHLLSPSTGKIEIDAHVGEIRYSEGGHYITGYRKPGEIKELFGYMEIPKMSVTKEGSAIITGNHLPLLVVGKQGKGNVAQWTSLDWMYYSILGPMGGMDDCLWKSMVWAARKPFVMQALPPIATMRVDDVVGSGRQQWNVSPFQWIKTANKYGLKPWLALFIYNITPEGIDELRELMVKGMATGTPHAFGRPPRKESQIETIVRVYNPYYAPQMAPTHFVPDYWYPNSIPYLSDYYDEFIFFDHNNQKPWPTEISKKALQAVDDWYRDTGLPMGKYFGPHWGEMNADMMAHVQENWGIDMMDMRELDKSWLQLDKEYDSPREGVEPPRTEPFKLYDDPVVGKKKEQAIISRTSYNSGFREFLGRKIFDFSSLVCDITGFEWAPDNNVEATADRGIKTLSRGLEAKAVAVLLTHETDYIYAVKPENWDAILKKVNAGISCYNPVYLTTDDALKIARAYQTSQIEDGIYDQKSGALRIRISGTTDVPTGVYIYTDNYGSVSEKFVEIPVFQNEIEIITETNKYEYPVGI